MTQTYFELLEENQRLKKIIADMENKPVFQDEVLQGAIDRNKQDRINWKAIFGRSLSKVCADYYAQGMDVNSAFAKVKEELEKIGVNKEGIRRAEIGVHSRFGELNSEISQIKRTRNKIKSEVNQNGNKTISRRLY